MPGPLQIFFPLFPTEFFGVGFFLATLVKKVKFVHCFILGEKDREKKVRDKQKRSLSGL